MKKILISVFFVVIGVGVFLYYKEVKSPMPPAAADSIRIYSLQSNAGIVSPLTVDGEARGNWFFEAVFPVRVLDGDGTVIGAGQARAQSDWMTTDFVPFKAVVEFTQLKFSSGTVVFAKDNPSGLPQNAGEFRVPVRFESSGESGSRPLERCYIGGCSSQVCSDKPDVITTCEWTERYTCYRTARCERQANGECGWTMTPELQDCLIKAH